MSSFQMPRQFRPEVPTPYRPRGPQDINTLGDLGGFIRRGWMSLPRSPQELDQQVLGLPSERPSQAEAPRVAPARPIGIAPPAHSSPEPSEPLSPAAYPNLAKCLTEMANPPATPPAANPTAPVAKTLPGAAPAMPTAPVAPAVKPSNPAGDYEAYLQRSIANPAASYEGPGGKVAVYRGRMPGSPTGDMSNAQFQEMRRIGLSQQLAALRGQESQGVEAQAKLLHGQAEMEHAKAANARVGVEMQKVQNERPGAAAEELFKHPERASSIGLLKGLTPEQAAVLGGSVKNAVSPQPISPLNYRSRLSEYPDLQRLLDDPTRKVHEVLAMARHFPGAEDPNNPIAQLIQAHYQNYLGGDENVRNLYADYLGQTPHERGESWLGYLSPFNIGGHAERARQADIVRSGLKQFNVPIPPRPSSF